LRACAAARGPEQLRVVLLDRVDLVIETDHVVVEVHVIEVDHVQQLLTRSALAA
jgi:hypothetical protein